MKGHLNKSEKTESKLSRILNSTFSFVIAYLFVNFGYNFFTAISCRAFGMNARMYFYGVHIHTLGQTWSTKRILFVYSAGFMFCFFLGIISIYLYNKFRKKSLVINLLFLWLAVISISTVIAQSIIGCLGISDYTSPFYQNLAVVYAWLRVPIFLSYVFLVPFVLLLLLLAKIMAREFISFTYSFSKISKRKKRQSYFLSVALLPAIIGSLGVLGIIALYYEMFNYLYITIVNLGVIVFAAILSMVFLLKTEISPDDLVRYKNLQSISLPLFLMLLFFLTFYILGINGFQL